MITITVKGKALLWHRGVSCSTASMLRGRGIGRQVVHTTGDDSKRVSDVEESTESPDALLFIGGLVAERPKGNDRNPEDSPDRLSEVVC